MWRTEETWALPLALKRNIKKRLIDSTNPQCIQLEPTINSQALIVDPGVPAGTGALVRSGQIFTRLITDALDLTLVEILAQTPVRLASFGTETLGTVRRLPAVEGTL